MKFIFNKCFRRLAADPREGAIHTNRRFEMITLLRVLSVIYIIICVVITVVILLQEGKQAGLTGAISGAAESYWGKNKGRSMEGMLVKITKILAVFFMLLAVVLNLNVF